MDKRRRTDNTMDKRRRTDITTDKRRRTDNTMDKRRRTDNTMDKRRRTDNTMDKRRRFDYSLWFLLILLPIKKNFFRETKCYVYIYIVFRIICLDYLNFCSRLW
jgi:hypothetical protein